MGQSVERGVEGVADVDDDGAREGVSVLGDDRNDSAVQQGRDDNVPGGDGTLPGIDVGGGAVTDSLEDERGASDEFDVTVHISGLQASAEFVEECPDLSRGEFSAAHAVARLRSRMKTLRAASSAGVSDMMSCFIGSLMLR